MWKPGAPKGEKIPYRLPELIATPLTKPVYVVEGEGKADLLAKIGFTVTSSSGGADDGKGVQMDTGAQRLLQGPHGLHPAR